MRLSNLLECAAERSFDSSAIAIKVTRVTLMVLVWIPFLGSNYLTITHLITWLKTDHWPGYSTASLFSDLKVAHPDGVRLGVQPMLGWIMSAPAAYSLMGMAIVLSITLALLPDD